MASTDARAGFRLPWSSDRTESTTDSQPELERELELERAEAVDALDPTDAPAAEAIIEAAVPDPGTTTPASSRRPTKFLADLTSAMRATAEEARAATLDQFRTDAKSFLEGVHARSADEATALRRLADDDVAAVREWSKAEIAAIREETERRISVRREALDGQLERHAAVVEAEIERVQARIAEFESEMDRFLDSLRDVADPAAFAALAERMPEPVPFEPSVDTLAAVIADETSEAAESPLEDGAAHADADQGLGEADVAAPTDGSEADETTFDVGAPDGPPAAAEPDHTVDAVDDEADEAIAAEAAPDATDLRLAALGIDADFEAAEAAAAADAALDSTRDAVSDPVVGGEAAEAAGTTTDVIVVGLVSVASIAGFKRHLGRLAGVNGVGVASTADGEFVFTVDHAGDLSLGDLIPSLPGFQARVLGTDDAVLRVSAHDPEADA